MMLRKIMRAAGFGGVEGRKTMRYFTRPPNGMVAISHVERHALIAFSVISFQDVRDEY